MKSIVISGGGTGGHIFPAIAIADEIKVRYPNCNILFVGARGRMEEEKVPLAGYEIKLLDIKGLNRKKIWKNFAVLWLLYKSIADVKKMLKAIQPDAVIGVGGYASAPTLMAAQQLKIPTLIQEQNSYAGVTNKLLAKKAKAICVAYTDMERFFPKELIHFTGNPLRKTLLGPVPSKTTAAMPFLCDANKQTLLILGGSLGARSINEGVLAHLSELKNLCNTQVLWQTGKTYYEKIAKELVAIGSPADIHAMPFIKDMDKAYALADVLISRAGAASISEIEALGKPSVLVPSPNVAENHQWHNAMSLVRVGAALMVEDAKTKDELLPTALDLLQSPEKRMRIQASLQPLAKRKAAQEIVDILEQIISTKKYK